MATPIARLLLVSLWGHDAQTRLANAETGATRPYAKVPCQDPAVSRDGVRIGRVDRPYVGPGYVLIKRLDGSIVERTRLPRETTISLGDRDLWIQ